VLLARLLVQADDLRRLGWVQRFDLVLRLDALAADDEVILAAKLAPNLLDRRPHFARVLFFAEIG